MKVSLSNKETFSFSKYHGLGNDFIIFDDREDTFVIDEKTIEGLCHRNVGIGADGVILLQESKKADFRFRIFNSDGKEAFNCGNGLRCLLQYLGDLGFEKKRYSIELTNEVITGEIKDSSVLLEFPFPSSLNFNINLQIDKHDIECFYVYCTLPHLVVFVPTFEGMDLKELGRNLRWHKQFAPEGVNVNFVKKEKNKKYSIITFERGIEGLTLACGTGAVATAIVVNHLYNEDVSNICFPLGQLQLKVIKNNNSIDKILMEGEAKRVYTGEVRIIKK